MVPWAHASQPPNGISISSDVFAQLICMPNTQTQSHTPTMLRATYVAIGRINALRECDAASKRTQNSKKYMQATNSY